MSIAYCEACKGEGVTMGGEPCECAEWRDVVFMVDRTSSEPDAMVDVTRAVMPRTPDGFVSMGMPRPTHVFVHDGHVSAAQLRGIRESSVSPKKEVSLHDLSAVVLLVLFMVVGVALGWLYGSAP